MHNTVNDVINFWFNEIPASKWFQIDPEFDVLLKKRFLNTYENVANGACQEWEKDAQGCLALCLVLDQFPRNMFRGQAKAFDTDKQALLISKQAIHKGFDQILGTEKRHFLYIPFMHSENINDQHRSVELFKSMEKDNPIAYQHAKRHYNEIEKFDRFPYRNEALNRDTSDDELEYLRALNE